jgi:hypothetical protein
MMLWEEAEEAEEEDEEVRRKEGTGTKRCPHTANG